MAQEINEVGILQKMTEQNVVFNKREFRSVAIADGESVRLEIIKTSNDGVKSEILEIDYNKFYEIESMLWQVVDEESE